MSKPTRQHQETPAWPVGCGVALLGMMLSFTLAGLAGIFFAAVLPPAMGRAIPLLSWLVVPSLMLAGWALGRRHNPYGARVLLWGFALSLLFLALLTALLDLINRLSGLY